MKINTIVIDDNPNWRKTLSKFVELNPLLNLVASCESALEAYGKLAEHEVDLLICDIEMPNLSGLGLAKSLQGGPLILFVTSHKHYAFDCYDVSPIDFLLKPLDYERFFKSIEKVRIRLFNNTQQLDIPPYFFIREGYNYVQIFYKDVLYIQAQEHFVNIITKEKNYSPLLSISKLEEQLKSEVFLRVHRSFIVNREYISQVSKNELVLSNGTEIPIGDQYSSQLKRKHIEGYLVSRSN